MGFLSRKSKLEQESAEMPVEEFDQASEEEAEIRISKGSSDATNDLREVGSRAPTTTDAHESSCAPAGPCRMPSRRRRLPARDRASG